MHTDIYNHMSYIKSSAIKSENTLFWDNELKWTEYFKQNNTISMSLIVLNFSMSPFYNGYLWTIWDLVECLYILLKLYLSH
jgi:hypothetical protein